MSFDLYFCWNKNERIDFRLVVDWAERFGCFRHEKNQLWYQNEETGVYFSLDYDPELPADPEEARVPPEVFDTGLSFNLNYNRPSYFALEAMPAVENLCGRFGLSVFDPQARDGKSLRSAVDVNASALIESWRPSNLWAIGALMDQSKEPNVSFMSSGKALYMWKYLRARKRLQDVCGEEVFVPKLVPISHAGTTVDTGFVCTQGIPTLLPVSDWVIVVREKKNSLFGANDGEKDVGVLARRTFNEVVGRHFEKFEGEEFVAQIIGPESVQDVARVLKSVEHIMDRNEFKIAAYDSFVDVDRSDLATHKSLT